MLYGEKILHQNERIDLNNLRFEIPLIGFVDFSIPAHFKGKNDKNEPFADQFTAACYFLCLFQFDSSTIDGAALDVMYLCIALSPRKCSLKANLSQD